MKLPQGTVEARCCPTWLNVLKTLVQTVLFWGWFLGILPWGVLSAERALGVSGFTPRLEIGAVIFGVAGATGIWCGLLFAIVGRGTPLPLDTATRLVILGPYRVVRNPMALAGITQGLAVGLMIGSWGTLAYALAGAVLWHLTVCPWEEADLRRRFGAPYEAYEKAVRLWIPHLKPYPALNPGKEA